MALVASVALTGVTGTKPAGARPAQTPPTAYPNPNGIGGSPFILKAGNTYYRYVSGFDYGIHVNIRIESSPDLVTWTFEDRAMTDADVGDWANASTGWNFSSPSVLHISANPAASQYLLYFTGVQVGTGKECIGHAVSDRPDGGFVGGEAPLVCPGDGEALEPSPHPIVPNAPYQQLVYRKTGTNPGIYNQPLAVDGQSATGAPWKIFTAADTTVWPAGPTYWSGGVVERPSVTTTSDTTRQLFFSGIDPVTGATAVGTVRCTAVLGLIEACAPRPLDGGRWFTSTNGVVSPRAVQVFSDGTHRWISYQAIKVGPGSCSGSSCVSVIGDAFVDKLCFADGVPRTNAPSLGAPLARAGDCAADVPGVWTGTWTTALAGTFGPNPLLVNRTLRQMVHTSIGGSQVRVRISNLNELAHPWQPTPTPTPPEPPEPLSISNASVAVSTQPAGETSQVQPTTMRPLTFGGANTVSIPPGGEVVSDAITLTIPADHDIAVSLYMPGPPVAKTGHVLGWETSHFGAGDVVDSAGGNPAFTELEADTTGEVHYVAAVDVLASNPAGSVMVMGDSLTDHSPDPAWDDYLDGELRWTDRVVDRLGPNPSVGFMNHGHIGARFLNDGLTWLRRDVLPRQGITTVVLAYGANDFYDTRNEDNPQQNPDIEVFAADPVQYMAQLRQAVADAHAAGLRVIGVTIAPYSYRDTNNNGTCNDEPITPLEQSDNANREWVNQRIRPGFDGPGADDSVPFDAVIDFDQVLRDDDGPGAPHPERVKTAYLINDCAHMTVAGQQALADAVDLTVLAP